MVQFKAEIDFVNEKVPTLFQRKPIFVCFLAETSDGRLVDFRRLRCAEVLLPSGTQCADLRYSASKMQHGHDVTLRTELTHSYQHITCYVMCDEIGQIYELRNVARSSH